MGKYQTDIILSHLWWFGIICRVCVVVMVAGSTAACKQKGRDHQKYVAALIQKAFNLPEEDVVSRPMGSPGLDIMLSGRARGLFPFGIECKRTEKLSIPAWWKQCTDNADKEGLMPMLVYRQNHGRAMVVMQFTDFLEMIEDEH